MCLCDPIKDCLTDTHIIDALPVTEGLFNSSIPGTLVMVVFLGKRRGASAEPFALTGCKLNSRLTQIVPDHPFPLALSFQNTSQPKSMTNPP